MSEREVEPLAPALQSLLAAERQRAGLAPDALDRVAFRLVGSVLATPADTSWLRRWLATRAGSIGAGFIVGAVAGGGVVSALHRREQPPAHANVPSRIAPAPPRQDIEPPPPPPTLQPSRADPQPSRPPRSIGKRGAPPGAQSAAALDRDLELAAERAPLETARTALARGNADAALGALAEHERTFPRGRLVEEREALRVQALVKAARFDEARRAGRKFDQTFPGSLLAPAIDAALREIP